MTTSYHLIKILYIQSLSVIYCENNQCMIILRDRLYYNIKVCNTLIDILFFFNIMNISYVFAWIQFNFVFNVMVIEFWCRLNVVITI